MVFDRNTIVEYDSGMSELRRRREELQWSQAELARRVGTSQPQIKRLEDGERKLTKEWATRIAPHLGMDPEELLFPVSGHTTPKIDRLAKRLEMMPMDDLDDTIDVFEKYLDVKESRTGKK